VRKKQSDVTLTDIFQSVSPSVPFTVNYINTIFSHQQHCNILIYIKHLLIYVSHLLFLFKDGIQSLLTSVYHLLCATIKRERLRVGDMRLQMRLEWIVKWWHRMRQHWSLIIACHLAASAHHTVSNRQFTHWSFLWSSTNLWQVVIVKPSLAVQTTDGCWCYGGVKPMHSGLLVGWQVLWWHQTTQCWTNGQWSMYEGRSRSSRPDLVLFRIKLKYYLLLIVAKLRTQHAQYDFWAIIFCAFLRMKTVSVRWMSRMLTLNGTQVSEELLKRYRRDPAKIYFTTRYSGWNVHPQLRLWVRTTKHAMERMNRSKL